MLKKILLLCVVFITSFAGGVIETPKRTTERSIAIQQTYVGNRNTKKFHKPNCNSVYKIKEKNKTILKNRNTAIEKGYVPCKICNP